MHLDSDFLLVLLWKPLRIPLPSVEAQSIASYCGERGAPCPSILRVIVAAQGGFPKMRTWRICSDELTRPRIRELCPLNYYANMPKELLYHHGLSTMNTLG